MFISLSACSSNRRRAIKLTCKSAEDMRALTAANVAALHMLSLLPRTNSSGKVKSTRGLSRRLPCASSVGEPISCSKVCLTLTNRRCYKAVIRPGHPKCAVGTRRKCSQVWLLDLPLPYHWQRGRPVNPPGICLFFYSGCMATFQTSVTHTWCHMVSIDLPWNGQQRSRL